MAKGEWDGDVHKACGRPLLDHALALVHVQERGVTVLHPVGSCPRKAEG